MRRQKLAPALDKPKGIRVNSYKPDDPAQNAVLWMSASSIANCKYPWARSNEVNQTAAFTAWRASSIRGRGNESRIVTALRALKSMHKLTSPVFYGL